MAEAPESINSTQPQEHLNPQNHHRSEEDKSIQHIRSLGKQVLGDQPFNLKNIKSKNNAKSVHKSSEYLLKPSNLYDKYKELTNKKIIKEVHRTKQIIIKQEINRTPEKNKADKKYEHVTSKIQVKSTTLRGLNYAKKADIQAQRMRKIRNQTYKAQKQMKQKLSYFQKNGKTVKLSKQAPLTGVLKRTEQMQVRKQKCVQRIRTEQLQKQVSHLTFQPQMVSRKILNIQSNFQKRTSLANTQRLSNQKLIIKQTLEPYSFVPQTNTYKNEYVDSKVSKIWQTQRKKQRDYFQHQKNNSIEQLNMSLQQRKLGEHSSFKSQNTANTTAQINLKNLNQLSFIFQ